MKNSIDALKYALEVELLGKVPLFFSELMVFDQQQIKSNREVMKATARRIISVPKYQTDQHVLGFGLTKPISKSVNYKHFIKELNK